MKCGFEPARLVTLTGPRPPRRIRTENRTYDLIWRARGVRQRRDRNEHTPIQRAAGQRPPLGFPMGMPLPGAAATARHLRRVRADQHQGARSLLARVRAGAHDLSPLRRRACSRLAVDGERGAPVAPARHVAGRARRAAWRRVRTGSLVPLPSSEEPPERRSASEPAQDGCLCLRCRGGATA